MSQADFSENTWLVTGGAGFIGSAFVGQQVEQGRRVVVLDALTYAGHRENLEWIPRQHASGGSWELVVGSITDQALIARLLREHGVGKVVSFAAESHVDNSISGPGVFIETNIMGTYAMLQASLEYWKGLSGAAKESFRYLQISTDEVYGTLGETGKFTEESPMKPNSPYSASKAAGDHLVRAWFETYNLPAITTNCTNNYGPRQFPEKLIPTILTRALSGQALPVYGDGKNVRDWIHVEDHAAGVALALLQGKPGETYAFGGNAEKQNIDLVHTLCGILDELRPRADGQGYAKQIAFVPDRPGHDRRYAIDDSKAQATLGYSRKYTFESGMRATVEWYLANQAWCDAVVSSAKGKKAA